MPRIDVLQGYGEVGGVSIRIKDGDRAILLDQGLRFSLFKKLYRGRVQPASAHELREEGVLPPYQNLEGLDALYITHLHLDHVGLLGDLPENLVIKLPGSDFMNLFEEWYGSSPTWTSYLPPRYSAAVEEAPQGSEDKNGVLALPVYHSAYPAVAYLYFGSDATVLYTGDFRMEFLSSAFARRLYRRTLFEYFAENPDLKVDVLIVEGTNFGRPTTPLTRGEFWTIFRRLLKGPLLIALHHLDLDLALGVLDMLGNMGLEAVVASGKLADVLYYWSSRLEVELKNVYVVPSLAGKGLSVVDEVEFTGNPERFAVLADLFDLVEQVKALGLRGGNAILVTSEQEAEEALEENVALEWLSRYGFNTYRLRVSGHYYPYEFSEVLGALRPASVLPVHSSYPRLVAEVAQKAGVRVFRQGV